MAFRLISLILSLSLFCQQAGIAYASGELNLANYLSSMRNAAVQPDVFQPARLRYISYDINNNDFKLLLDKGDAKLNNATQELFNYFLIGLALPNDTFWVNLRPDAPENIIDPLLEKTDIGKIFLEADLQLKKDTASLTSPQNPEGKAYWDKLYKKAGELFGSENITIPTITRPWIVPNEVIVRETEDSAYIYKATLKVMLESDYLIGGRGGSRTAPTPDQYAFSDSRLKELNEYSSRIIRETIIPRLTREVNSSKRYAKLRQVYYSLILARWFKQKYSSLGSPRASEDHSTTLGASQSRSPSANSYLSLIDSKNLANLISQELCDKQTYFQAYQKSFKDGEYNLKETIASPSGQSIRSYISGGVGMNVVSSSAAVKVGDDQSVVTQGLTNNLVFVSSPMEKDERPIDARLIEICREYKKFSIGYGLEDAAKDIIAIFKNGNPKFKYTMDIQAVDILEEYMAEMKKNNKKLDALDEAIANNVIGILGRLKIGENGNAIQEWGLIDELLGNIEKIKKNPYKPEWIEKILKGFDPFFEIANFEMSKSLNKLKESIVYGSFDPKDVMMRWMGARKEIEVNLTIPVSRKVKIEAVIKEITDLIEEQIKLFYENDVNQSHKQQTSGSPLTEEDFKEYLKSIKEGLDGIGRDVRSLPQEVKQQSGASFFFDVIATVNKLQNMPKPLTQVSNVLSMIAVLKENLNKMRDTIRSLSIENIEEQVEDDLRSLSKGAALVVLPRVQRLEKELQNISASPLTTEDMRKIKIELREYAETLAGFYNRLSSVDLTDGVEQRRFGKDYKNYSRDLAGALNPQELMDGVRTAIRLTIDKRPPDYTVKKWQKILVNLEWIENRIDLTLKKYAAELSELFGDKEEALYKYFSYMEKGELASYRQKYGQPDGLKNIDTAIGAAKAAVLLYKKGKGNGSIDVREKWEKVAAVLGEINSINGQWLGNKRKVQSSLSVLRFSIEEWYGGLPEDTKNKWLSDVRQEMGSIALPGLLNIQKDISKYDPVKSVLIAIDGYAGELGVINSQAALNAFVKERAMVYMLSEIDVYLRRFQEGGGIELLPAHDKEITKKLNDALDVFRKEMISILGYDSVSSALARGGIDLTDRFMRLNIERVGSFADLRLVLPEVKNAQDIDLDKEFKQIEAIASSGIVPNSRRILELFSACYSRGEFGQRLSQVISCLKASSAIQEKLAIDSDDDFRMCLLLPEIFSDGG